MFKKYLLFSIVFLVFISLSCKEEIIEPIFFGNISGVVQNSESNEPIENVVVTTNPSTSSVTTDANGKFSFVDLEVGEYSVIAEKDGYSKKTITLNVEQNKSTATILLMNERNTTVLNTPPNIPILIAPINENEKHNTTLTLSWSASDEDNDTLYYDVYLFSSFNSDKQLIADNISDTSIVVNDLVFASSYFWQVIVTDNKSDAVNGEVWSFDTKEFPLNPIIFSSNISGNYEIYSTEKDTISQNVIPLTNTSSNEFWPRFNPTRDLIAYVGNAEVSNHIYTMNLDGSDIYKVTQVPIAGFHNNGIGFCWSADGNSLYYSNYDKLYMIKKDGSNLTQIATAPAGRNFREIDISPNENKIVALTIGQNFYDSEIYLVDMDSSKMSLLVSNLPGAVENPVFSVDGKSIIYTHDASENISSTNRQLDSRIYSLTLDSLAVTDLSVNKTNGTNDSFPRFSKNGASIIFENVSNDASVGEIIIMDKDGNNRRRINAKGRTPDWK